jgi:hypothetical protein
MSIDAIPGFSAGGSASLIRTPTETSLATASEDQEPRTALTASQTQATAQTSQVSQAVGGTATAVVLPKPSQPLLMVPTEPLTPKVLAELIGRQLP